MGRQIGEAGVEAEDPGDQEAERQMETVEGATADEQARGHGSRQLARRRALCSQLVEKLAQALGEAAAQPGASMPSSTSIGTDRSSCAARASSTRGRICRTCGLPP